MNTEELFETFAKCLGISSTQLKMMLATPDKLIQDIVRDHRRDVHSPSSLGAKPNEVSEIKRGSGWQEATPLGPPPGIAHIDRLVDAQDEADLAALAEKLVKGAAMQQALKAKKSD